MTIGFKSRNKHGFSVSSVYILFNFVGVFFSRSRPDEKTQSELSSESSPPLVSILSVMATTEEVTVSMGEVMVVKSKDEDECDEADKAQVILQLQPIPVG